MGLFGIAWEIWLEPLVHWGSIKWVRFIVRKQRIWEPGTPFPRYFGQIRHALLCTPFDPWRIFRALLPVQNTRQSWDQMVFEQYRR